DVVAICSPNVPEYAIAFHAVAMAGGCNTTLNPLNTEDELIHQVGDSGAKWFVTVPALLDKARAVASETDVEEIFVFGEADGATPFAELLAAGAGEGSVSPAGVADPATDLVTLPYSSGTTGRPKGVMLTHENLVANIEQYRATDPIGRDDVVIAVLPFFHIYGMVVIMSACLREGATLVTLPRFDLEGFLATLQDHRVNRVYAVPPIVLALAKHPIVEQYDLSAIDYVMSGAAPLGQDLALACQGRLGCKAFQGYGLTEASPVTHLCSPNVSTDKIATVGQTVAGSQTVIVDLEGGERLGPNEEGEVWVRGPQVMAGYLNNPDATARTIDDDGWLHTGDVGRIDEDGYLTIVDRAKELIKYKGFQVPPAELEDILLSHDAVADVAVIPVADEEAGEIPKAFIVAAGEVDGDALMAFVAERVSSYKQVRVVEFVDEIPKSASGKILRRILVARERGEGDDG
ncbi:MAG: AMP-binding protein, partial [Gemmatimonadetes bacterium]|nr:AMP-binding protein [Gemmatimonadota bacterium]